MLPQLWASMDNSMPDCGRHWHFGVAEKLSDMDDCFPLAGDWTSLVEQRVSTRVFCMEFPAFIAD
jgi:hypothetical protein